MVNLTLENSTSEFRNIKRIQLERVDFPLVSKELNHKMKLLFNINEKSMDIRIPNISETRFKDVLRKFSRTGEVPMLTFFPDQSADEYIMDTSRLGRYDFTNFSLEETDQRFPGGLDLFEYGIGASEYVETATDSHLLSTVLTQPTRTISKTSDTTFINSLRQYDTTFSDADCETIDADRSTAVNTIAKSTTAAAANFAVCTNIVMQNTSTNKYTASSILWNPTAQKWYAYTICPWAYYSMYVYTSADGLVWTKLSDNYFFSLDRVVHIPEMNLYIGVCLQDNNPSENKFNIYTSTNGANFTLRYEAGVSSSPKWALQEIQYLNGNVIIGTNKGIHFISNAGTSGTVWTKVDTNTGGAFPFTIVQAAYGASKYVATGWTGSSRCLATSTDGISWTQVGLSQLENHQSYNLIAFHPTHTKFYLVSQSPTIDRAKQIAVSSDGLTWTYASVQFATGYVPLYLSYLANLDAVVGIAKYDTNNNLLYFSTIDGLSWDVDTFAINPTFTDSSSIAYLPQKNLIYSSTTKKMMMVEQNPISRNFARSCLFTVDNILGDNLFMKYTNSAVHSIFSGFDNQNIEMSPNSTYPLEVDEQGFSIPGMSIITQKYYDNGIVGDYFGSFYRNYINGVPEHAISFVGVSFKLHNFPFMTIEDSSNNVTKPAFPTAFHALDFEESEDTQNGFIGRAMLEMVCPPGLLSSNPLIRRLEVKYLVSLILLHHKSTLVGADVFNMFQVMEVYNPHAGLSNRLKSKMTIDDNAELFALKLNRGFRNSADSYENSITVHALPKNMFSAGNNSIETPINFDRYISRKFDTLIKFKTTVDNKQLNKFVNGTFTFRAYL